MDADLRVRRANRSFWPEKRDGVFESGIKEVVRGWNLTNEDGFLTPDSKKDLEVKKDENKKLINTFRNSYQQEP